MSEIVVGVDGSESSVRAAQWAVDEAGLRDGAVRVITAFQAPAAWLGMGEALGATMTTSVRMASEIAPMTFSGLGATAAGPKNT